MKAELVFVGTELLLGQILNTNAQYISRRLADLGVDNYYQTVVGDNWERLAEVLRQALGRADLVITSGGLGPTLDDITKEVAAEVLGIPLELHQPSLEHVEGFFRRRGREMTENNRKQALMPKGARVLPNPPGTAPGMIAERDGKAIAVLPGPPNEMQPMFESGVVPYILEKTGARPVTLVTKTLRFSGIGESALESKLRDLMEKQIDPTVAPYAKLGEVHLRLATKAATREEGLRRLEPLEAEIKARAGRYLYGYDEEPLEGAVGRLLREKGQTLAVAESCSGGILAKRLTDLPGSSDYFLLGAVTYANEAKQALLGVTEEMLSEHGAVSEPVARAMAEGVRRMSGSDWSLSVTGIAGPGGGTPTKPVGTVWFGLSGPDGTKAWTEQLWGSRDDIRRRSAQVALTRLWQRLRGEEPGA